MLQGGRAETPRAQHSPQLTVGCCFPGMSSAQHFLMIPEWHFPFGLLAKKTISTFKNDDIEFKAIMTTHSNPFLSQQLWDLLGRVPWGCRKFPFLRNIAKFALLHVLGSSHSGTIPLIWCGVGPPFFRELWLLGRDVCERICKRIAFGSAMA